MSKFEEFPQTPDVAESDLQKLMSPELSLYVAKAGTALVNAVNDATTNRDFFLGDYAWHTELPDVDPFAPEPETEAPHIYEGRYVKHADLQYWEHGDPTSRFFGSLLDFKTQFFPEGMPLSMVTIIYPVEPVEVPVFQYSLSGAVKYNEAKTAGLIESKTMMVPLAESAAKVRQTEGLNPGKWEDATVADGMNVFMDLAQLHKNLQQHIADGGTVRF